MERPPGVETSSVFHRQEQSGHRAVCFGDDPELFCVGNQIATHQSEPVFKAQFIFSLVVVAEIAPISA